MTNPYMVLGVPSDCSDRELKKAYRELSKKWHPDANPDKPVIAEQRFKEVQEAYRQISEWRKNSAHGRKANGFETGGGFGSAGSYGAGRTQYGRGSGYSGGSSSYGKTGSGYTGGSSERERSKNGYTGSSYGYGNSYGSYNGRAENFGNTSGSYSGTGYGRTGNAYGRTGYAGSSAGTGYGYREATRDDGSSAFYRSGAYAGSAGRQRATGYAWVQALIDRKLYDMAYDELMKMPSSDRPAKWFYMKAQVEFGRGKVNDAWRDLKKAQEIEPSNAEYRSFDSRMRGQYPVRSEGKSWKWLIFLIIGLNVIANIPAVVIIGIIAFVIYMSSDSNKSK